MQKASSYFLLGAFKMGYQQQQPHILMLPFPLLGHIKPMLSIAQLLCHSGLHVTFLNTEHNHFASSLSYKSFLLTSQPSISSPSPMACQRITLVLLTWLKTWSSRTSLSQSHSSARCWLSIAETLTWVRSLV